MIVDLRRQPASETDPDDAERNKSVVEQPELQAAVAKNTAHWPMKAIAWTPPAALPVTPTPSKGASVAGRTPGSPALEALASAAAQVERQSATTVPKGACQVLGQRAGGPGGGAAKPVVGVQLIERRPPGLIAPPLPASAGVLAFTVPDDETTQRCLAELALILGPTPLNVIQPASAAQPYTPPQATSTMPATAAAPARVAKPSPTPSLDQPALVIATNTSSGTTTTTQVSSTPSHAPTSGAPVVTVTTTTTIPLTPTPTLATVAQTRASAGVSTRAKSSTK